jgi:gliding motility associated protien GldN
MNVKSACKSALVASLVLSAGTVAAQTPVITDQAQTQSPATGESVNNTWKPSLVRDGVYDRVPHINQPLAWQPIRENDVLWKKRVWREIDTREKQNQAFRYPGDENTGGGYFIEILMDAVKRGKVAAYTPYDDRFVAALSKEQIMETLSGKDDTLEVTDPVSGQTTRTITHKDFDPELITRYRVKEDWIFDRNPGRMVVRIIGLAPVRDVYEQTTGEFRGTQPLFWIYYPEARETLAQYEVYNPENDVARMTWDDFFEGRMFSSRITKVSNGFGQDIATNAGGNNMESLYQGQRIAEDLFNKEHDMWVY